MFQIAFYPALLFASLYYDLFEQFCFMYVYVSEDLMLIEMNKTHESRICLCVVEF